MLIDYLEKTALTGAQICKALKYEKCVIELEKHYFVGNM